MTALIQSKGPPLSIAEALRLANPKYYMDYLYQINCQRCVWAFELLRRGYSVEAADSNSSDYVGSIEKIREMWMSAPNSDPRYFHLLDQETSPEVDEQYELIEKYMKSWGEGSRAILANIWNDGGGHIWNVEYSGGQMHYYDGQIGREVDISERNARSLVLDLFARVDNLDIPRDVLKAVIVKKRKR